MKVGKKSLLQITFSLSQRTLGGRPKYYYCSLLPAVVTERPVLLNETFDTRRHYQFLLFTFSFQILVMPKQRRRVAQNAPIYTMNYTRKACSQNEGWRITEFLSPSLSGTWFVLMSILFGWMLVTFH